MLPHRILVTNTRAFVPVRWPVMLLVVFVAAGFLYHIYADGITSALQNTKFITLRKYEPPTLATTMAFVRYNVYRPDRIAMIEDNYAPFFARPIHHSMLGLEEVDTISCSMRRRNRR